MRKRAVSTVNGVLGEAVGQMYVFEEMSSYDIARELNGKKVLGPEEAKQVTLSDEVQIK